MEGAMRTVSAREANQQFSKLLEAAVEGEEVTITRRGVPVAKLVPFADAASAAMDAESKRRAAIEWLRSGPLPGKAPSWTRDELYERDDG
jgi:prevent-host-death family protein